MTSPACVLIVLSYGLHPSAGSGCLMGGAVICQAAAWLLRCQGMARLVRPSLTATSQQCINAVGLHLLGSIMCITYFCMLSRLEVAVEAQQMVKTMQNGLFSLTWQVLSKPQVSHHGKQSSFSIASTWLQVQLQTLPCVFAGHRGWSLQSCRICPGGHPTHAGPELRC